MHLLGHNHMLRKRGRYKQPLRHALVPAAQSLVRDDKFNNHSSAAAAHSQDGLTTGTAAPALCRRSASAAMSSLKGGMGEGGSSVRKIEQQRGHCRGKMCRTCMWRCGR
jgi:hypothetical protein